MNLRNALFVVLKLFSSALYVLNMGLRTIKIRGPRLKGWEGGWERARQSLLVIGFSDRSISRSFQLCSLFGISAIKRKVCAQVRPAHMNLRKGKESKSSIFSVGTILLLVNPRSGLPFDL